MAARTDRAKPPTCPSTDAPAASTTTTTTTLKMNNFLSRPLRDATLSDVPGVGPATLAKLKAANIETATQLVGHFLLTGSDTAVTSRWLKDACEVRETEAVKVAEALHTKAGRITAL